MPLVVWPTHPFVTDEKPDSTTRRTPDFQVSLLDAWEAIGVLEEKVTDLVQEQSAILIALVRLLPSFAREFQQVYSEAVENQEKAESGLPQKVRDALARHREKK